FLSVRSVFGWLFRESGSFRISSNFCNYRLFKAKIPSRRCLKGPFKVQRWSALSGPKSLYRRFPGLTAWADRMSLSGSKGLTSKLARRAIKEFERPAKFILSRYIERRIKNPF
ncbi:MAG: hypothetical protein K8T89_13605, partial [Planctomycetes bacterium]|nr:hypothetical protein [Planctomycetota bacterium]